MDGYSNLQCGVLRYYNERSRLTVALRSQSLEAWHHRHLLVGNTEVVLGDTGIWHLQLSSYTYLGIYLHSLSVHPFGFLCITFV